MKPINFGAELLKDGILRVVNNLEDDTHPETQLSQT